MMNNFYTKALLLAVCIISFLQTTKEKAHSHGFCIVEKPHFHPPRPPRPPFPPYPVPPRPIHKYLPLELKKVQVTAKIADQVAQTTLEQTFYNPSNQRIEGSYIFPIPKNAEIESFQMEINGKMTKGEILDSKKAKSIYEKIVRESRDPALLEYTNQGIFKIRVFPIEPKKDKTIKIKYKELLRTDSSMTSYKFPLRAEKFLTKPVDEISLKISIDSENGINSIYSPSHKIDINRENKTSALLTYEEKKAIPETNLEILFSLKHEKESSIGFDFITHKEKGEEKGYFAMLITPGNWKSDKLVPKDVIFVIDSSGSMRVKKLDQAKSALNFCLKSLNKNDQFEIIRYSTETEALFSDLKQANKRNIKSARDFIQSMQAGGGTAIEEALIKAINTSKSGKEKNSNRPKQIIFITDGRPTIGETRTDKIIDRLVRTQQTIKKNTRIFSFGIGTDINTKLLDLISQKTRASTEYVLPEENIELKISRFYSKVAQPVMTNIAVKTESNIRLSENYPKDLPDLFKGDQLIILGRYKLNQKNDNLIKSSLQGNMDTKNVNFDFVEKINANNNNSFIARLWATRKVGYLLEEIRLHGDSDELKETVVKLARKWGIVTPYTSFLILEDEEARGIPVKRQSIGNRKITPKNNRISIDEARLIRKKVEAESFLGLSQNDSGDSAVAASRASNSLKSANQARVFKNAYKESQYGSSNQDYEQQKTRRIAGKTFFQNASGWIDSLASSKLYKDTISLKFASDPYFKLLDMNPKHAEWLSLGANLVIVIDGKLFEITNSE